MERVLEGRKPDEKVRKVEMREKKNKEDSCDDSDDESYMEKGEAKQKEKNWWEVWK